MGPDLDLSHHFLTLRLARREADLLVRHVGALRGAMRQLLARHPTRVIAMVVLPNRLHALWCLPEAPGALARRVALLKAGFSRPLPAPEGRTPGQLRRREKGIWCRGHWAERVAEGPPLARCRARIHRAPVLAGLCARPQDWPFSSIHRDLRRGGMGQVAAWAPGAVDEEEEPLLIDEEEGLMMG